MKNVLMELLVIQLVIFVKTVSKHAQYAKIMIFVFHVLTLLSLSIMANVWMNAICPNILKTFKFITVKNVIYHVNHALELLIKNV